MMTSKITMSRTAQIREAHPQSAKRCVNGGEAKVLQPCSSEPGEAGGRAHRRRRLADAVL